MRRSLLYIVGFLVVWLGGFATFIFYTKSFKIYNTVTEAIVVFTGGKQRVGTGIGLLKSGYAPILFISGVGASPAALDKRLKENGIKREQVIYGMKASNTLENAIEIGDFITNYRIKSVRLVTSSYHMPRALLEIRKVVPYGVIILPHPVYIDQHNLLFLFKEYHKYLIIGLMTFIGF